jgi:hypothetical protein
MRSVATPEVVISGVADLLAVTGCNDVEALESVVDSNCEPDVWVVETVDGIEVGSGTSGIVLEYPFTMTDFWATVDEVEQAEIERIENGDE